MLFNSIEFLLFFPIVVVIYFAIPQKLKQLWLLLASYYFYMCWNAKYAILILLSTAITYASGLLMDALKICCGNWPPRKSSIMMLLSKVRC